MTGRIMFWVPLVGLICTACAGDAAPPRRLEATSPGTVSAAAGSGGGPVTQPGLSGGAPIDNMLPGTIALTPSMPENPGACNQDVDIVFVLDVSGSMAPPLTRLDKEVDLVDAALKTKNLPSPAHYGLVIFVDDWKTMNAGAPYMTLDLLKAELTTQISMTSGNAGRQVDPNGFNVDWPENSLDALFAAAMEFQWRPAATTLRTIIHITDASFWDLMDVSSGADTEKLGFGGMGSMHSYAQTIDALRAQKIWVNTFSAHTGGPPDGMMSPPSHGDNRGTSVNVGIGFFEPYKGMPSIAMQTGGFAWDIDDVFDGKISLAQPINMSIEVHQCAQYPLN
jgi:hypothetical protein